LQNKKGETKKKTTRSITLLFAVLMIFRCFAVPAQAKKPNILVMRGDDVGWSSLPGPSGRSASYEYDKRHTQRMFALIPAQAVVAKFPGTFKEFPPRQKPASFSVGDTLSHMETHSQGK
jgi:hypothetical protein